MVRGKICNIKRGEIIALYKINYNIRRIAKIVNCPKSSVFNVIQQLNSDKENAKKLKPGPKPKLDNRDRRSILRSLSSPGSSANSIRAELGLNVSKSTVLRAIKSSQVFNWKKMNVKPQLTSNHRKARLAWAQKHMSWTDEWLTVLFSDEKKFNLDGPDGLAYYWHDIRKEKPEIFSRAGGGGNVMVSAAFSYNGTSDIAFIDSRLDADKYIKLLDSYMLPCITDLCGPNATFQQDNAPCHAAKKTKSWINSHKINLMNWPSKSPDLNPIENLWGILVRSVYANHRQFSSVSELKSSIIDCWFNIKPEIMQNLVNSMPSRVFETISRGGAITHY